MEPGRFFLHRTKKTGKACGYAGFFARVGYGEEGAQCFSWLKHCDVIKMYLRSGQNDNLSTADSIAHFVSCDYSKLSKKIINLYWGFPNLFVRIHKAACAGCARGQLGYERSTARGAPPGDGGAVRDRAEMCGLCRMCVTSTEDKNREGGGVIHCLPYGINDSF